MTERIRQGPTPEQVAPQKTVLNPQRYFEDAALEAHMARESIVVKAMHIEMNDAGRAASKIFESAPRGVRKRFVLDWYTRLIPDGDKIVAVDKVLRGGTRIKVPERTHPISILRLKYRFLIKEFKQKGVTLAFTNPPKNWFGKVMPFVGRDHIKTTIIDDGKVAYFGGVNFDHIDSADFMVKFVNTEAQVISKALDDIHEGKISTDEERTLNRNSTLYIDAGIPSESLILDQTTRMVEAARTSVEHTSLTYPDGQLEQAICNAAQRCDPETGTRIKTDVIVSSAKVNKSFLGAGQIFSIVQKINRLRSRLKKSGVQVITIPQFVHAKLLIVDRGTPYQRAYFGTHNLSSAGVKAGTREWGIITTDPELIENLGNFFDGCKVQRAISRKTRV